VANAPAAIAVNKLEKTYKSGIIRRNRIHALRGASFEVPRGEIFGLLGPNGAGKTTLIKILLGIVRKSAGDAELLGKPAGNRPARRSVGYLPEHHRIPRHLTGNTALEYYGSLSGMRLADIRRKQPEFLKRVGLADWGKTPVKKYSKGMLQRLGLAQAMLHDPDLLILDEPTDGVDPVGRAEIRDVLNELKRQGKTIFLNSHLLQEIELICDRVAILDKGIVRTVGRVDEITRQSTSPVAIVVQATESAARAALAGFDIRNVRAIEGDNVRIELIALEQHTVDGAIDALRKQGISIASVSRTLLTLEQAFLQLLQNPEPTE
jgi:ABC-2 type transport system ATP-binding protein